MLVRTLSALAAIWKRQARMESQREAPSQLFVRAKYSGFRFGNPKGLSEHQIFYQEQFSV